MIKHSDKSNLRKRLIEFTRWQGSHVGRCSDRLRCTYRQEAQRQGNTRSSPPGSTVRFALPGERACPQLRFLYTSVSIIRIIPHRHNQRHLPGGSRFFAKLTINTSHHIRIFLRPCICTLPPNTGLTLPRWFLTRQLPGSGCGAFLVVFLWADLLYLSPYHWQRLSSWVVNGVCGNSAREPNSNLESSNHKHTCYLFVVRYEHACTHAFW